MHFNNDYYIYYYDYSNDYCQDYNINFYRYKIHIVIRIKTIIIIHVIIRIKIHAIIHTKIKEVPLQVLLPI